MKNWDSKLKNRKSKLQSKGKTVIDNSAGGSRKTILKTDIEQEKKLFVLFKKSKLSIKNNYEVAINPQF